jgi:transposase
MGPDPPNPSVGGSSRRTDRLGRMRSRWVHRQSSSSRGGSQKGGERSEKRGGKAGGFPSEETAGATVEGATEVPHAFSGDRFSGDQSEADDRSEEALGRSRGGFTTKIHLVCDGKGRPLGISLSAGQRHDSTQMEAALDAVRAPPAGRGRPRKRPARLNLDKGYSYSRCRRALRRRGISAMIPERQDQREHRKKKGAKGGRPCHFDKERYRHRNVVERCFLRLKQWRRIATRYDKQADTYLAFLTLASIILWLP